MSELRESTAGIAVQLCATNDTLHACDVERSVRARKVRRVWKFRPSGIEDWTLRDRALASTGDEDAG